MISKICSSPGAETTNFLISFISLNRIDIFMIPSRMRKPAEIDVPMMPPILLNTPNLELIAEAVAATTTEVVMTTLMEEDKVREPCQ